MYGLDIMGAGSWEETEIGPVIRIAAMRITGNGITANFVIYILYIALA